MIRIDCKNGMVIELLDATALIDLMSDDDRMQTIESLSCYDNVINHVVEQIGTLYGCTENGCAGSHLCDDKAYAGGGTALDNARYQLALSAGGIAKQTIERQSEIIKSQQQDMSILNDEIFKLKKQLNNW